LAEFARIVLRMSRDTAQGGPGRARADDREPPTPAESEGWPRALTVKPQAVMLTVAAVVGVAWGLFVVVDLLDAGGIGGRLERPLWVHLFNDRPVEWTQWFLLPATTLAAAYAAGRIAMTEERDAASFFLLLALATGLMMIEDAGDVRHVISGYARDAFGETIIGLPYRVVSDVPLFALLAAVPIYAIARYGRRVWCVAAVRPFLVAGYVLYFVAAVASGLRHLGDLYVALGSRLDAWLLDGRMPVDPLIGQDRTHFMVVDSLLEESIEAIAAASLLGAVLAYITALRARASGDQPDPRTPP
jgi:hypothetical protein